MTMDAADEILEAAGRPTAVAIGPGLGRTDGGARASSATCSTASTSRSSSTPTGFGRSPGHLDWVFARDAPTVLTPHEGELARLLGRESSWVAARRLNAVQAGADDVGAVVLLKGADTLVASPGARRARVRSRQPGARDRGDRGRPHRRSSLPSWPRGWTPSGGRLRLRPRAASPPRSPPRATATAGMIASDVVEALSPAVSR